MQPPAGGIGWETRYVAQTLSYADPVCCWGKKSVGGGEFAGLLDCHLLFVALDDTFTSLGAQDHAPAHLALVSSP